MFSHFKNQVHALIFTNLNDIYNFQKKNNMGKNEESSESGENIELIVKKSDNKFEVVGNAFIQRDYTNKESRDILFEVSKFPPQLDNRLEKDNFESAILEINLALEPLNQKNVKNFLESWVSMVTCMLSAGWGN